MSVIYDNFAIVGDLHIAPIPSSRIDEYFETGLDKITQIASQNKRVIFLGDIFTHAHVNDGYVYDLIQHLYNLKQQYGTRFYTIIGNHDVTNELESNLRSSSLGIMAVSGVIEIITPGRPLIIGPEFTGCGKVYKFHTIPVNFDKAKEYIKDLRFNKNDGINILLVHHEYEGGTNCFTYNDFKDLGCDYIFLGHDHKPLIGGRIIYPEFTIYRSGSIMRNRAEDYNFTRTLYYYEFLCNNVSCKAINHKPASDVFKIEALTRQNYHKEQFVESVNVVIDKYKKNISTQNRFSIKNILEELQIRPAVIDRIKTKHEILGERFE